LPYDVYHSGVDNEKELWQRLENETDRAFEAFRTVLSLPAGDRTLVAAYRHFVGNPNASKVSDAWNEWSRRYAWRERAQAYDAHIDRIRRNAMEEAIEQEAAEQARQAERGRNHLNELMAVSYLKTMDFLENVDPESMRFSDAIQVARLHMEAVEKLGSGEEGVREDDWTEEDDAEIERIAKEIKARRNSEEGAQGPDEQVSQSDDSDEDRSEESEGGQD
jgi:hypothetical protein